MIYFDNSATTIQKPQEVSQAVAYAIQNFGNPGRSFCSPSMIASRAVFSARKELAQLVQLDNPLNIAWTSGATESLNLVIQSLITAQDSVITSVLEHNSVLRPLYNTGCNLSFIECDEQGNLLLENLKNLIKKNTRFVVCTHGSNLIGTITDVQKLYSLCKEYNLILILDCSQTLGSIQTLASMADIICFTGHKALFGPQGTGGIIVNTQLPFKLVKTGGSGSDSFDKHQRLNMPDIFEAGTHNAHGLAGLQKGIEFINALGLQTIIDKEKQLMLQFLLGINEIKQIKVYGLSSIDKRLPVIALSMNDISSSDLALQLWEGWHIATRAGSHCAPLAHIHFGTKQQGMLRFSFSYFNTEQEIACALDALKHIAYQINT